MNEFKISKYLLEWNLAIGTGRIILGLVGKDPQYIDNLNYEKFIIVTKVLEKGNAWIRNGNIIFNKFL